jgi:hypothetical protein
MSKLTAIQLQSIIGCVLIPVLNMDNQTLLKYDIVIPSHVQEKVTIYTSVVGLRDVVIGESTNVEIFCEDGNNLNDVVVMRQAKLYVTSNKDTPIQGSMIIKPFSHVNIDSPTSLAIEKDLNINNATLNTIIRNVPFYGFIQIGKNGIPLPADKSSSYRTKEGGEINYIRNI